tara:strand:+ start:1127 stop:1492 length:366 start_codon:yes stop_codon:yes gene_type:complete
MKKFSKHCKPFNKENVSKLSNKGGVYVFFNKKKEPIYVGRASGKYGSHYDNNPNYGRYRFGLRHRLQSYYQKDQFHGEAGHPEKKKLRPRIAYFRTREIANKTERRATEKRLKQGMKFNSL